MKILETIQSSSIAAIYYLLLSVIISIKLSVYLESGSIENENI